MYMASGVWGNEVTVVVYIHVHAHDVAVMVETELENYPVHSTIQECVYGSQHTKPT